jgi:hypothetical protein
MVKSLTQPRKYSRSGPLCGPHSSLHWGEATDRMGRGRYPGVVARKDVRVPAMPASMHRNAQKAAELYA